ncbi:MAG: MmgE/PrpD family protein [Proteobacteria bacterium]|nr:MmgE/PrpD family protein [Pseudomonadota bacterium]
MAAKEKIGVTQAIARKATETTFDSLPPEVIQASREVLLDGTAVILAGSQTKLGGIMTQYVRSLGGPRHASVMGSNLKTHVNHAAFANGTFCHAMDYEMMWTPPTHPTGPVLPAILALAEQRDLSGKDAILALAIGFEVQGRMRMSVINSGAVEGAGIHPPGSVGPIGSAVACAKILGLDALQTARAMGIAGSRIGGLQANKGTMTKSTHCGHAARMGLESATLAGLGYTGSPNVLEAPFGFNDIFFNNSLNLDLMIKDFGKPYRMADPGLAVKKYPAHFTTHWAIDAALAVRRQNKLDPNAIKRVEVEVGADNKAADVTSPDSGIQGHYSIPYTVAAALLDGEVVIDTFRDDRRFAPDIERLMPLVEVKKNPKVSAYRFEKTWSRVTVWTSDGRKFSARVDRPLGIWDNPLPWDGRVAKFRDCAKRVLGPKEIEKLLKLIERFEKLKSLRPMMDLLRVPSAK